MGRVTHPLAEQADRLRGLLEKATARPWRVFDSVYGSETVAIMKGDRPKRYSSAQHERWKEIIAWPGFDGSDVPKRYRRANADLIVAAVNALPALLAHIASEPSRIDEAQREERERCATIVDRQIPEPAGGPFSHTNSMRVVLIDAASAIRAALDRPATVVGEDADEAVMHSHNLRAIAEKLDAASARVLIDAADLLERCVAHAAPQPTTDEARTDDMVLVPRRPTEAMRIAWDHAEEVNDLPAECYINDKRWDAALSAAPRQRHLADEARTAKGVEGDAVQLMKVIGDMRRTGGASANEWADKIQDILEGE